MLISFVIPCYRSENTLPKVVETIEETVAGKDGFEAEIVLVNDCSPDNTWQTILDLTKKYDNIKGIDLAKTAVSRMRSLQDSGTPAENWSRSAMMTDRRRSRQYSRSMTR